MKVLGIETSCDETAVSIVCDDINCENRILSHFIFSQIQEHQKYGGVVPEIAARAHLHHLQPLVKQSLIKANLSLNDLDGIAVTAGPGLMGGVLVGVMMAKAIAMASNKPLIGVNHLEGHALTIRLTHMIDYPYLLLLMSGGHCQFVEVKALGQYRILGQTLDDAAGEAFDKVSKLLGLGYPGGPLIEKIALKGDSSRFKFALPLVGRKGCDFSFSGLKTAVRQSVENLNCSNEQDKTDIAASFQKTVGDHLTDRLKRALQMVEIPFTHVVVAGGVAANTYLKERLHTVCEKEGKTFLAPPLTLCTDNAAMIAWAGLERLKAGFSSSLDFSPKPRWSLEDL